MAPASRRGPLSAIGGAAARHPWMTLGAWVLLIGLAVATAVAGIGGESLFDRLKSEAPSANGESSRADE